MFRPEPKQGKLNEIQDFVNEKKLTYAELGRILGGFSRDYISKLILGKRPISEKVWLKTIKELVKQKENDRN